MIAQYLILKHNKSGFLVYAATHGGTDASPSRIDGACYCVNDLSLCEYLGVTPEVSISSRQKHSKAAANYLYIDVWQF